MCQIGTRDSWLALGFTLFLRLTYQHGNRFPIRLCVLCTFDDLATVEQFASVISCKRNEFYSILFMGAILGNVLVFVVCPS